MMMTNLRCLHSPHHRYHELKHVVIVGSADYVEREWDTLATLPKVGIYDVHDTDILAFMNMRWDTLATLPKVNDITMVKNISKL